MKKNDTQKRKHDRTRGYTITEAVVTSVIIGVLGSITIPNFVNSNDSAKLADAKSSILTIPSIISAYIDSTGEAPTTWDDLSTITTIMTNEGPATGDLNSTITLPNSIYDLSVKGPTESVYTLTATRVVDKNNNGPEDREYQYAIKSCFNISNGASDQRSGNLSDIENTLNCG
jgi:type II secretory pathway pseudopilin PulG